MNGYRVIGWVSGSLILPSIMLLLYGFVADELFLGAAGFVATIFSIIACIETIDAE